MAPFCSILVDSNLKHNSGRLEWVPVSLWGYVTIRRNAHQTVVMDIQLSDMFPFTKVYLVGFRHLTYETRSHFVSSHFWTVEPDILFADIRRINAWWSFDELLWNESYLKFTCQPSCVLVWRAITISQMSLFCDANNLDWIGEFELARYLKYFQFFGWL